MAGFESPGTATGVFENIVSRLSGAEPATVTGQSGGGAVLVRLRGIQRVESITIAPGAAEDVGLLEELVAAAVNDALTLARVAAQEVAFGLLDHLGGESRSQAT